jgi:hypothetical protein
MTYNSRLLILAAGMAAMAGAMSAQVQPRRMTFVGNGAPDRGKCAVEVTVDGSAEIEIFGDTGTLKDLSGAPPVWRRLECTGPLPRNVGVFRFAGVSGRGHQQLVAEPRNGGPAVVRIEDPSNGAGTYVFEVVWENPGPVSGDRGDRRDDRARDDRGRDDRGGDDAFYRDRDDAFRGNNWRGRLFARIREDLDHAQRTTFPVGRDEFRIVRVLEQLNELQDMQSRGRYDRRELDDVIESMRRVVADNRLRPRDRDMLNDDLNRLQDFRDRFRDYGVRDR